MSQGRSRGMKRRRAVVFSGTTEGRELVERLASSGVECVVCVATEYGATTTPTSAYVALRQGRMTSSEMRELYRETEPDVVVDATHPYAQLVTATIRESLEGSAIPYLRVERSASVDFEGVDVRRYEDASACAKGLSRTSGRILLTTGSKELPIFCADESVRERLVVRVLPTVESLQVCEASGLNGRQIIAAHGPFTTETNLATIRQYGIATLVTKRGGFVGGEDAKLEAARIAGITVHMIQRPAATTLNAFSARDALAELGTILGVDIVDSPTEVALVGIGCGGSETMTFAARERIEGADFIFGAPRMLDAATSARAVKRPYYTQEKILPELARIRDEYGGGKKVAVLFSGDVGFYSGCAKLYEALKGVDGLKTEVLPGVSSVTLLAARVGVSWEDAEFISLHGAKGDQRGRLLAAAKSRAKTFFITSNAADVATVAQLLDADPSTRSTTRIVYGRNLSYPDELIRETTPSEAVANRASYCHADDSGLYVGVVLQSAPQRRLVTTTMNDRDFIRGDVPMTKEEIRALAIGKLKVKSGDVVYDIGAGTGSVAVQLASLSDEIEVVAFERNDSAAKLIESNRAKYALANLRIVTGVAPDALRGELRPDAAFIGGSGRSTASIVEELRAQNPRVRIVIAAVTMETISASNRLLETFGMTDVDVVQVSVARVNKLGSYHMLQGHNPVFLYSFTLDPDAQVATW